jgi:hypothetical protein
VIRRAPKKMLDASGSRWGPARPRNSLGKRRLKKIIQPLQEWRLHCNATIRQIEIHRYCVVARTPPALPLRSGGDSRAR